MDDTNKTIDLEFETFYKWVLVEFNMDLRMYKQKQLQRRILNIMKNTGCSSLTEYRIIIKKDSKVRQEFTDYLTINVTDFFRNPDLFDEFDKQMTGLKNKFGDLKIWSAACSIGAEPYSIAMLLDNKKIKLQKKILATDIDATSLNTAKQGRYRESELKNISQSYLDKYFKLTKDSYEVSDGIKKTVHFEQHDLLRSTFEGNFHVIVCRNVTIYFNNQSRDGLYKKFSESLIPGGIFFTGATETINNPEALGLKKIAAFIYEKQ